MSYGVREEDCMIQLSSTLARDYVREAVGLARTVSRFDAQVTVEMPSAQSQIAQKAYTRAQRGTGKKGRPTSAQMILSTTGGKTLYLGAKSSDRMLRIYDKGIESGVASRGKLWRCEAVLRKKQAMPAAKYMAEHESTAAAADAITATELRRKAGKPFWSPSPTQYAVATGRPEPSTVERKLNWLRGQVSPTVAFLLSRNQITEVLEALGLSDATGVYLDDSSQP